MNYEMLPFARGTHDAEGAHDHLLGREYEIEDIDFGASTPSKPNRSGKIIRLRLVKNASTIALLPRKVVKYSTTAGQYKERISGQVSRTAEEAAGVVDEFLPAAGVPAGANFYIVVRGPSEVLTPVAGGVFNGDIGVGTILVAATAAASTGTTAGRVSVQNITASSATSDYSAIMDAVQNRLGRALSAATTGQTNTAILCEIGIF